MYLLIVDYDVIDNMFVVEIKTDVTFETQLVTKFQTLKEAFIYCAKISTDRTCRMNVSDSAMHENHVYSGR